MANFKVVCQYTQPDHGFTEVYYREAGSLAAAANFTPAVRRAFVRPRATITVLRKIRVSDVANNRNSVVVNFNEIGVGSVDAPDIVSTSAIVTLVSTSVGAKRQLWLRGLADKDVMRNVGSGTDHISAELEEAINNLVASLAGNGFLVRALQRLGTPGMNYISIQSVTVTTTGRVTITTATPFLATASNRVILSQLDQKLFPGLNGHWSIRNVTANSFDVSYNSHLANGVYTTSKGRTRPEEYQYGAIDRLLSGFNRFGSRDTGKNPLGGRGRRSSKLLRSA